MSARKSMSIIGTAIVVAIAGVNHTATAGIDAGGKPGIFGTTSKGRVSAFGSIYVNGVRFNTDSALFLVDGALGSEADLDVGQVVTVRGTVDAGGTEGTAWVVTYRSAVEGPVDSIDPAGDKMTVLGQTVIVDGDTTFSGLGSDDSLAGVGVNAMVSISGYEDAAGNIIATHVSAGDNDMDIMGSVVAVDENAATLIVNGLAVDYGSANLFELPSGSPQIGQRVVVDGVALNADGELVASAVSLADDVVDTAYLAEAQIEGVVTALNSWGHFDLSGTPVRVTWNTQFDGGWVFGLGANQRIEVEGRFDESGTLVADRVVFQQSSEMSHSGYVEAIEASAIVVDGTRIDITPNTAWDDDSDADDQRFHLTSLRTGDFVEFKAYASNGGITATLIERDDELLDGDESDSDESGDD